MCIYIYVHRCRHGYATGTHVNMNTDIVLDALSSFMEILEFNCKMRCRRINATIQHAPCAACQLRFRGKLQRLRTTEPRKLKELRIKIVHSVSSQARSNQSCSRDF